MVGLLFAWFIVSTLSLFLLTEAVYKLHKEIKTMAILIEDLITKVTALKTVEDSLVALIQGIKAQLDAAIAALPNQTQLQTLSDGLDAITSEATDAVTANTPAAEPTL